MEIQNLEAVKILSLMEEGQCTSVDVVSSLFCAINERDGEIGAYLWLDEEDALEQARRSDSRRAAGRAGPLEGVPIALKDIINVAGQKCTCGSRILEGYVSPYDATVVSRLRDAGAILFGRTNMDEFGMGSTTENSGYRITRNPRNLEYVPGGSSGGSAAAVAGNMAVAALGTDTGGSLRLPASYCGCVGLKPSYGRVSRYGLTAYASSLDQIGPLTKSVADSALLLSVIAGHDDLDSSSVPYAVPDYDSVLNEGVKGMKVGVPREYFKEGVDSEIESMVHAAVQAYVGAGAEQVEVSLPHTEYAVAAYYIIATAEASANLARFDGVRYGLRAEGCADPLQMYCRTRAQGFGKEVKRRIILGTYALSSGYYEAYYLSAQKVRTLIRRDFEEAFKKCDVILAPVSPGPACKIGEKVNDPLQMYLTDVFTVPASVAGICGISVPCGLTSAGLPVGLQILGGAYRESDILRAASAFESFNTGAGNR